MDGAKRRRRASSAANPVAGPVLEPAVHFEEHTEGRYRIYAGALESRQGDGYIAAAVVVNGEPVAAQRAREAWRDDSLACGHRWASPAEALRYAITRAREVIRKQPKLLAR